MKFFVTVCIPLTVVVTPTSSCIWTGVVLSVIVNESERVNAAVVSHNDSISGYNTIGIHNVLPG